MESERSTAPDVFKALGDPVRWTIIRFIADQPELAGSVLDDALAISRPTISYHIRILTQAGLVEVSKRGRNHYYTVRQDVLRNVLAEVSALMPGLQVAHDTGDQASSTHAAGLEAAQVVPTW